MNRSPRVPIALLLVLLGLALPMVALANSSWVWLTKTRPYDILPFAAMLTIAAEAIAVNRIPRILKPARVLCVVALVNLLSFAAPYLLKYLFGYYQDGFNFFKTMERYPFYTVGIVFAVLTVVVELPVVYAALRKHTEYRKRLLLVIVLANIATTGMVALCERVFAKGHW